MAEEAGGARVAVAVRVRPLGAEEEVRECDTCVRCVRGRELWLGESRRFTFDVAYDESTSQRALFEHSVAGLVDGCLQGYNATVLAYGQTGSGKTYTMGMSAAAARMARRDAANERALGDPQGVLPRVCELLFARIADAPEELRFSVKAVYLEVYNETVLDLLARRGGQPPKKLHIRDKAEAGGVLVKGAKHASVESLGQALELVELGAAFRATGSTKMNAKSSRSHAIFSLVVERVDTRNRTSRTAKFHLVDLAGSERNNRTGAVGERFQESIQINQGLLSLGNVISILGADSPEARRRHVPYRQSKLTRLLRDSLGGNSRTLFIACVSPADESYAETLNTLKYANRARNIENTPIVNEARSPARSRLPPDLDKLLDRDDGEPEDEDEGRASDLRSPVQGTDVRRELAALLELAGSAGEPGRAVKCVAMGLRRLLKSAGAQHALVVAPEPAAPSSAAGPCLREACATERAELQGKLRDAEADLERDETIFAGKMGELQALRDQLANVHEDREQLRLRLIELEEENRHLLNDASPGSQIPSVETTGSAFGPSSAGPGPGGLAARLREVERAEREATARADNLRDQLNAANERLERVAAEKTLAESASAGLAEQARALQRRLGQLEEQLEEQRKEQQREVDAWKASERPVPSNAEAEDTVRGVLRACAKARLAVKRLSRDRNQVLELDQSRSELEQSLSRSVGRPKDSLRAVEKRIKALDDSARDMGPEDEALGALLAERSRLERERKDILAVQEGMKDSTAAALRELAVEREFASNRAKQAAQELANHGLGGASSVAQLLQTKMHEVFASLAPANRPAALAALCAAIAELEEARLRDSSDRARLRLAVEKAQAAKDEAEDALTRERHSHAEALEAKRTGRPSRLDQAYIASLEKDLRHQRRTIAELTAKTREAQSHLGELAHLREEHANLKAYLRKHSQLSASSPRLAKALPVPVRLQRGALTEIQPLRDAGNVPAPPTRGGAPTRKTAAGEDAANDEPPLTPSSQASGYSQAMAKAWAMAQRGK